MTPPRPSPARDLSVVGVGDAGVDLYFEVDHIPSADGKVLARDAIRVPGGMVANFLVACRRLGLACGFNGVVGDDEFGRLTIDDLAANGVDVDAVAVRRGGTTYYCAVLLGPGGEKALIVAPTDCIVPAPADVSETAIRRARHLHVTGSGIETAAAAVALAKTHGLTVSLDVEESAGARWDDVVELVRSVDLLFVGAEPAFALTGTGELGAAADALLRLGPRLVCLTLGSAGSLVATPETALRMNAYNVTVVDSTGAGDAFAAGIVHGCLDAWPLERTARFATAVAALNVLQRGGHQGAPRLADVERFLAEQREPEWTVVRGRLDAHPRRSASVDSRKPALPPLPDDARPFVEPLVSGRPLGASRQIRMMYDLLAAVAGSWTSSVDELVTTLTATTEFFVETRGMNTPAIGNALEPVARELQHLRSPDVTLETVRRWVDSRRAAYNAHSMRNVERMAEYGASVLDGAEVVIPFDYSSTMLAILALLSERGKRLRLVVPESRCLNGGRPIVEEATAVGHSVAFVPDMSVGHFIRAADAVLIGAETIFANGDCWNTIGSYPLAELARIHDVPFYVATELIKIDPRSFDEPRPPVRPRDFSTVLGHPWTFTHPERISMVAPELDTTPASLITAYITPVGVLPPDRVAAEARELLRSNGEVGDAA